MVPRTTRDGIIGVLIADDHPVVRQGLRAALSAEQDIGVLGEARDGLEAEELALLLKPEVIILDLFMPKRDGLDAITSIKRNLPNVRILILTVSERAEELLQAIRRGADGYLLKKSDPQEIANAVRGLAAGQAALSPQITAHVMREIRQGQEATLSGREREVLGFLAAGLTNHEIAERMVVSQSTVGVYVSRLLHKFGLKKRAALIAYSLRHPTLDGTP